MGTRTGDSANFVQFFSLARFSHGSLEEGMRAAQLFFDEGGKIEFTLIDNMTMEVVKSITDDFRSGKYRATPAGGASV